MFCLFFADFQSIASKYFAKMKRKLRNNFNILSLSLSLPRERFNIIFMEFYELSALVPSILFIFLNYFRLQIKILNSCKKNFLSNFHFFLPSFFFILP